MSALDMVMQRQVPARPTAKAGEGAGTAVDGKDDAFSAALSQEKRSTTADRERVDTVDETDAAQAEADEASGEQAAQSDEILNLLTGLMSSASYSDDAALGKAASGEVQPAEAAADMPTDADSTADRMGAVIAAAAGNKSAVDTNQVAVTAAAKTSDKAGSQIEAPQAQATAQAEVAAQSGDKAKKVSQQANAVQSDQRTAAPAVANVASAAAAQAASQPAPKTAAADAGADRQKDQTSVREVMRALGIEGPAQTTDADAGKRDVRSGNGGRQRDVADRRLDDTMGAKGGKVEVVESRKFMPVQNMSANGQLLTRSLVDAGSSAIAAQKAAPAQQLAQTGLQQSGQTLHTLKLQLNPASLGSVTAVLKLTGDELSVEIKVQTAEAYRQIKEDNQSMLKALRAQGFGVEQITVQHVTGSDRASSQGPQQGFQASQQGTGSNDAQSSGRESGRNNTGQQGTGGQGGQAHEQGSYSGAGAGRTDGVYL